jgi:hypothetical protein
MTTRQRILCLEAACTASEYPGLTENIRAAVGLLAAEIDEYFEQQEIGEPTDFGVFLLEQREAVEELSRNPAVFGAEPR